MKATTARVNFLLLVPLLLSIFLLFPCYTAIDFITQKRPLLDADTLVSQGDRFELGFFSVSNSKNRYLGVWFKQLSIRKVVWVANRENPLTDSSEILSIDNYRNLVVNDGRGRTYWSSNSTSAVLRNSTAELLDSGNLVLNEEASSHGQTTLLWQSFDHPSDSFISLMKLGFDLKTGENQRIMSRKSQTDPSLGHFSAGLERQVLPQAFLYNGYHPIWRSGQWNGHGPFLCRP